jgi:hypothetical protein
MTLNEKKLAIALLKQKLQSLLKESISLDEYEEPNSTFTHNKQDYSLNKLFDLSENNPIAIVFIKDLKWQLQSATHTSRDEVRVSNADIKVPVLILPYNDRWVIIDGMHRLEKAMSSNLKVLPAKIITQEQLNSAVKK